MDSIKIHYEDDFFEYSHGLCLSWNCESFLLIDLPTMFCNALQSPKQQADLSFIKNPILCILSPDNHISMAFTAAFVIHVISLVHIGHATAIQVKYL